MARLCRKQIQLPSGTGDTSVIFECNLGRGHQGRHQEDGRLRNAGGHVSAYTMYFNDPSDDVEEWRDYRTVALRASMAKAVDDAVETIQVGKLPSWDVPTSEPEHPPAGSTDPEQVKAAYASIGEDAPELDRCDGVNDTGDRCELRVGHIGKHFVDYRDE